MGGSLGVGGPPPGARIGLPVAHGVSSRCSAAADGAMEVDLGASQGRNPQGLAHAAACSHRTDRVLRSDARFPAAHPPTSTSRSPVVTACSNSCSVWQSTQSSESFFHHFSASPWLTGADADARAPAAPVATGLARGVSHGASMGSGRGSMLGPGPRRLHSSGPQGLPRGVDLLRGGPMKHAGVRSSSEYGPAYVHDLCVKFMAAAASEGPRSDETARTMIGMCSQGGRAGLVLLPINKQVMSV
jgi:hypothetical protein